ncbi:MAG: tetratricopeptide repeat protein [Planctomycetales bacterium]
MNSLDRFLKSRLVGWLLLAVMAVAVVSLVRGMWPGRGTSSGPETTGDLAIPALSMEDLEPGVREHIAGVREGSERVINNPASTPIQRARAFGELGRLFTAYDLPAQAIPCLANAGRLDPSDFRWPYLLAHMYSRDAQIPLGAAAMAEAVRRMPGDSTVTAADQLAAHGFLANAAQKLDHPDEARRIYDEILAKFPTCAFALFHRGQLAAQKGDAPQAIADLLAALEQMPRSVAIRQALANAYRKQGDAQSAAKYTVPAQTSKPENPIRVPDPLLSATQELNRSGGRFNRRGVRLYDQGRFRAALIEFNAGLKLNPNLETLRVNRANSLLKLERPQEAQRELAALAVEMPDNEGVRLAHCLSFAQHPATREEGLALARAWREERPQLLRPIRAEALCHLELARYAEALGCLEEAARREPDKSEDRLISIWPRCALGQYSGALQELESLTTDFPNDPEVTAQLVRFLACCPDETQRDGARGVELLQRMASGNRTAIRLETLACALAESGELEQALAQVKQALEICGEDGAPPVRRRMEAVLKSLEAGQPYREPWPFADPRRIELHSQTH